MTGSVKYVLIKKIKRNNVNYIGQQLYKKTDKVTNIERNEK